MSDAGPAAPKPETSPPVATPGRSAENSVCSRTLLGNHKLLLIEHRGEIYRLRETRSGKLILNK